MIEVRKEKWLILSHCFNMDGRAASITITDKLPYLEQAGIEPVILSGVSGTRDEKYEHYQFLPWGPAGFRFDIRHVIALHLGHGFLYKTLVGLLGLILSPFILLERLLLAWQNQWSWSLPAVLRGLWLIRKYKPAVLYSTGGAYSAHLAGYWLKHLTGIKWIVEIHDSLIKPGLQPQTRDEKMQAYIERIICRSADFVWWFTEGALLSARERHPELQDRGAVILPGVGQPTVTAPYRRGDKMVIAHFGSLSDTRSMRPFVEAMHQLLQHNPQMRGTIRVHVYGGFIDRAGREAVVQLGLQDIFVQHGRLEHSPETGLSGREQALQKMHQSDCLLLIHGTVCDCREYIPSKLYEYLWTGRPVLALTYQNPQLDALVKEYDGFVAPGDSKQGIVDALEQVYARWEKQGLPTLGKPGIGVQQAVEKILGWLDQQKTV